MASLPASVSGGMAGRLSGSGATTSASRWHRLQAVAGRWMISPIQRRAMQAYTADNAGALTHCVYQRPVERQAVLASDLAGVPATFYRTGKLPLLAEAAPLCEVHFRLLEKPNEDAFSMDMGLDLTLGQVVEAVAGRIGIDDPTRVRIRPASVSGPAMVFFELGAGQTLKEILMGTPHVLYIELLEKQTVQITFHSMMEEVSTHNISVWRDFTAKNVLNALKPMVKLTHADAEVKLLKYSNGHSFKLYKDEDYVDFAEYADDTPYSLHAHEHYGGPYQDVVINVHLLKINMDGTVKNREYVYIFLHSSEKMTVQEIKMKVQEEINWPADLKSRLLYLSPSKSFEILDSHILCDLFQSQPSRASQEYLQWEIFETEKRKREESEGPSSPKKLKASFDMELGKELVDTCRRGTRFCGPTEEEEEALERCFKDLEAGPEMGPSMAQLDPIQWAQLDPIETHLEDVGAHSSEGFGPPVHFPSSPVSDVKAGGQRDKGKGIMYIY